MKAVVFYEHGGIEQLKYEDVAEPKIDETDVLLKVKACALNHLDIWARKGLPGIRIPFPHISGSDISGEVYKIGRLVKNITPGQKVIVSPGIGCGRCNYCLSGRESYCRSYQIIGYQTDGGYAEYVKVPEANLVSMPSNMNFEEAASIPLVFLTAWHMLVTRGGVKPGEYVLVLAAGSGVGSAAVQIARLWGARVIGTVGSAWKAEKAKEIGAEYVINHNTQSIVNEVKRLTDGKGVEVVIEHVGASTWEASIKSLTRGGRMITCGATSGYLCQTDVRYIYSRQLSILGSYMGERGELLEILKFFEEKKLKPVIDSIFPLEKAAEAQKRMEESKHFGKIILRP